MRGEGHGPIAIGAVAFLAVGVAVGGDRLKWWAITGAVAGAAVRLYWDRIVAVAMGMGGGDDVDEAEAARRAYVDGEIGEDELERRLYLAVDPEASVVVEALVDVDGVGPATAAAVAEQYPSAEHVAAVDVDELADAVDGVGPERATAIRNALR